MAFLEPKLKQYEEAALIDLLDNLIVTAFQMTGTILTEQKEQAIDDTLPAFVRELQLYSGTLTFKELELIFAKGWRHEYGKFTGLNPSTYWKWINLWTFDEERIRLRKVAENRIVEVERAKVSEEEKDQIVVFGILKQFANYKDDPKNALISTVSYDYIKNLGIIVLSDDQRARIWAMVEKELKEEAILSKGAQSVERALQNVTREMIITGSKKRALKEYFDTIIEFERDLLTEINDHKAKKKE